MVTMRDIARESGYSLSTVSRVVNQEKYVSDEVRAKVQAVIDAHDYATNRIAQDLSHGENRVVGVVLPDNRHPYFEEILRVLKKSYEALRIELLKVTIGLSYYLHVMIKIKKRNF